MDDEDGSFHLYSREWAVIHTVRGTGIDIRETLGQARFWVTRHVAEKVMESGEVRFIARTLTENTYEVEVELLADHFRGNYSSAHNAASVAQYKGYEEYVIVPGGTEKDTELRSLWRSE